MIKIIVELEIKIMMINEKSIYFGCFLGMSKEKNNKLEFDYVI